MLRQGGWPILVLAGFSLVAVAIAVERALGLRRAAVFDRKVLDALERCREEADVQRAYITAQRAHGPFARLIEAVISARYLDHAQSVEAMHAAGRTQLGRLQRGLTALEIIASASPLIGLLGTVLGMVTVFDAISARGLGNPQVLADGIGEALITTIAGLCVAIPALACHSWFSKRAEEIAIEMQNRATTLLLQLQQLR